MSRTLQSRSILIAATGLIFLFTAGAVILLKGEAQTTSTTIADAASGTPQQTADQPPVITAFVKSANELHPTTIYAGLRAYVSVTINDDLGITSGGFNAPGMKYSSADVSISGCQNGVRSCSEPVYIIVPSNPGPYTVTVRATDTAGQTSTLPISFTAAGCSANSECGGTYFPSSGATFCGPSGASLYTDRMKYQVVSICDAGTCNEKTEPGVLENCTNAGKVCGFAKAGGGQFQCVANPGTPCVIGNAIASSCLCGPSAYEYYGYCCQDSQQKPYHTTSVCPPPTPPPPPPPPPPSPSATSTPAPVPPSSGLPQPPIPVPTPTQSPAQPTPENQPPATLLPTTSTPVIAPPTTTTTPPIVPAPAPLENRPLTRGEIRALKTRTREAGRQIQTLEKTVKKIEKSKLGVDPLFKTSLAEAKEALGRFRAATDSKDSFEAAEDLADIQETLNAYLPRLEQLVRTPDAVRIITQQISEAARIKKNAQKVARRLKVDTTLQIEQMTTRLESMKETLAAIKTASVEADDLHDYIQENVSLKLDEVRDLADQITAITNVQKYLRGTASRAKQFEQRIARREKNGDDMTDARALLNQFSGHLDALKLIAANGLTNENAEEAVVLLRAIAEVGDELEDELQIISLDALEQQLERLFLRGAAVLKKFEFQIPN